MSEQFSILIDSRSRFETGEPGGAWLSIPTTTEQLVDPLHIKKCSEANAARRDELLTELDTKIKVSNATVFVEIEE